MGKKRILFVVSTYPSSDGDVLVPWMRSLTRSLSAKGYHIDVLAPAYKGSPTHTVDGITVYRFRYSFSSFETLTSRVGAIARIRANPLMYCTVPFYIVSGSLYLFYLMIRYRYEVLHIYWPFPNAILAIVSGIFFKPKVVYTFLGAEFTLMNKIPVGRSILSYLLKKAGSVIAISTFTKKNIQQVCQYPVTVIPFSSGLVVKKSAPVRKRKTVRILYVGRLIARKGVRYLIESIPMIAKEHSVSVDIVGTGELENDLKSRSKKLGVQQLIQFHGEVSERQLHKSYADCDMFVLPAIIDTWGDTEGLGVVLLEAMSYEKPVIASRVGGIPDIVKHKKNGLLIPQKNPEKLARAIIFLGKNEKLRKIYGKKGRKFVSEQFSWESIILKTIEQYES